MSGWGLYFCFQGIPLTVQSVCMIVCGLVGVLASVLPYGPQVADHCILLAGLAQTRKPKAEALSEEEAAALFGGVQRWQAWLDACETKAPEGFILLKAPAAGSWHATLPIPSSCPLLAE